MRWRNRETPTFAGDDGSGNAPAIVEVMDLVDRDNNVLKTFTKSVAGVFSETEAGGSGNGLSTVAAGVGDFVPIVDVTAATQASGGYTIATLPVNNETIKLNGFTYTWKTSSGADDEITIGAAAGGDTAIGVSIYNLITAANLSADAKLSVATYTDNHTASNKDGTAFTATVDTAGAYGNNYSFGTKSAKSVRTGPTATGGADESYEMKKAAVGSGIAAVTNAFPTYLTITDEGGIGSFRIIKVVSVGLPVTLGNTTGISFGSKKLFTFAAGKVHFLSSNVEDFLWGLTNVGNATPIVDTMGGDFSLGSTATSDATLNSTDVNILASTSYDPFSAAVSVNSAINVIIDGTSTPVSVYLNAIIDDADVANAASDILEANFTAYFVCYHLPG